MQGRLSFELEVIRGSIRRMDRLAAAADEPQRAAE